MSLPGPGSRSSRLLFFLLVAALLLEGAVFVAYGRFNIDEGMHLNAGRLVYEHGRMLYRDLPFSQGPGGPYLYGAADLLFDNPVLAGRLFSFALGLLCVATMAWFAHRVVGRAGALLVLVWMGIAFPALWSLTQVRTEPGAIALATLGTIALFQRRDSALAYALAPVLLVWATAFRLTTVVPLAAVCLFVAWELRRSPRTLLAVAGIVLANGLLAAAPMWLFPKESFFHVVAAQANRAQRLGWTEVPFLERFRFFLAPETGLPSLLVMTLLPAAVIVSRWRDGWRPGLGGIREPAAILAVLLAMALLSYAPQALFRQGFSHYFANASLLLVLALAIAAPLAARGSPRRGAVVWSVVAVAWLFAAVQGARHLESWVELDGVTVTRLSELRDTVKRLAPGGCTMLTFETHLAVETGCAVTPGLEYSYFSFFPALPTEQARAHGVLNSVLLTEELKRDRPEFVALTWTAVDRITGKKRRKTRTPMLPGMRGHYLLVARLHVPVGPYYVFWNDVFVYARSDLPGLDGYSM